MPWTSNIQRQFQMISPQHYGAGFHGPYNKLLYTLFPADTDFIVCPRYEMDSYKSAEPRFVFDVLYDDKLVFMLEPKASQALQLSSVRDDADLKLRQRMEDLRPQCPLPVLYAVSALGTRLCFYKMHHDRPIQPPFIHDPQRMTRRVTGTAPQERWDCDILEEEGEKRLKAMVEEIKQACAAL